MTSNPPHLAILGAGPIGLDAALAAAERGWSFRLYDAGPEAGATVRSWGHVRLFSPWSMNLSSRMRVALDRLGHAVLNDETCPTGRELVEQVIQPLAHSSAIAPHLETACRVLAIGRDGLLKHEEISSAERSRRPFRLLVRDAAGTERIDEASAVLDASGAQTFPHALGDGGIPAPGELALGARMTRRLPEIMAERDEWANQRILLVGAGHSAQTAARDLATLAGDARGTRITWVIRAKQAAWSLPDDALPERARLTAAAEALARSSHQESVAKPEVAGGAAAAFDVRFGRTIVGFRETAEGGTGGIEVQLRGAEGLETIVVDRILALIGADGDASLYRQLQVHECYASLGPMKLAAALLGSQAADCLDSTSAGADALRNPEPDFYIVGAKSYGRTGGFLLRTGYAQIDEVFSLLAPRFNAELATAAP